jgi:DNA-binding XRE family transcriptional regulator
VNGPRLTLDEQANTLAALHFLRKRLGTWALLAKALGFERSTMRNVRKGVNHVSVNMAYRVARVAGVAFDDVVAGRWPVLGRCPQCGRAESYDVARRTAKRETCVTG